METKQIKKESIWEGMYKDMNFVDIWNNHIDDFNRLRFSLRQEHWDELDSVLDHLRQLVENASVEKVFREAKRKELLEEGGDE